MAPSRSRVPLAPGTRAPPFTLSAPSDKMVALFDRNLHFPLLADFHPKGEVAQRYSVYREQDGFCERALYVIDGEQRIFWSHLSPIDVNPGADGVLDALERLSARQPQAEARP